MHQLREAKEAAERKEGVQRRWIGMLEAELADAHEEVSRCKKLAAQRAELREAEHVRLQQVEGANKVMAQRSTQRLASLGIITAMKGKAVRERDRFLKDLQHQEDQISASQMLLKDSNDARVELASQVSELHDQMALMETSRSESTEAMQTEIGHYKSMLHDSELALKTAQVRRMSGSVAHTCTQRARAG